MVLQNPRYLINVGSDMPTIVVEGFRYNAMHLAAKVGNLDVAKYVLHLICDSEALLTLYGLWMDLNNSPKFFYKIYFPLWELC